MSDRKFERKDLIMLRAKATLEAEQKGLNSAWKRAYLRLADAADNLDAMIARTADNETESE